MQDLYRKYFYKYNIMICYEINFIISCIIPLMYKNIPLKFDTITEYDNFKLDLDLLSFIRKNYFTQNLVHSKILKTANLLRVKFNL